MEITQSDLELILKSIQEDLVKEAQEKQKAEASESESSESKDKKEESKEKKEKAEESASESASESSSTEDKKEEKAKSEKDEAVAAPTEDSNPNAQVEPDLYGVYSGLNPDELTAHLLAAVLASRTHAGHDMNSAWQAYKSMAEQELVVKSEKEPSAEQVMADKYVKALEAQNEKLVKQVESLEKSQKEQSAKFADLSAKLEKFSVRPNDAKAVTAPTVAAEPAVKIPSSAVEIRKSLAEAAKDEKLTEKDRELIGRYTIRPMVTDELKDFFKKIGSK